MQELYHKMAEIREKVLSAALGIQIYLT